MDEIKASNRQIYRAYLCGKAAVRGTPPPDHYSVEEVLAYVIGMTDEIVLRSLQDVAGLVPALARE